MKVLVLGNKGWIGSMMCDLLHKEDIKYFTTDVRPNKKDAFEKVLIDTKPTHIMSFIGRTHGKIGTKDFPTIDYLEQSGKVKENVRDNLFAPLVVAILAKKYNIHYTYLGTGCIFKFDETHQLGNPDTGFNENDIPNFFGSSYSIVKGYTDELMHLLEENVLNLRIRMPIISKTHPRNFITKITNYEYICSMPNSMTILDELLPYVIKMAKMNITGTINLTNPGLITHNEILELYKKYIDSTFTWKNFSQQEQLEILDADRSNNCLDTTKLSKLFPEILNIKSSIENILTNYKL